MKKGSTDFRILRLLLLFLGQLPSMPLVVSDEDGRTTVLRQQYKIDTLTVADALALRRNSGNAIRSSIGDAYSAASGALNTTDVFHVGRKFADAKNNDSSSFQIPAELRGRSSWPSPRASNGKNESSADRDMESLIRKMTYLKTSVVPNLSTTAGQKVNECRSDGNDPLTERVHKQKCTKERRTKKNKNNKMKKKKKAKRRRRRKEVGLDSGQEAVGRSLMSGLSKMAKKMPKWIKNMMNSRMSAFMMGMAQANLQNFVWQAFTASQMALSSAVMLYLREIVFGEKNDQVQYYNFGYDNERRKHHREHSYPIHYYSSKYPKSSTAFHLHDHQKPYLPERRSDPSVQNASKIYTGIHFAAATPERRLTTTAALHV